MKLIDADKLYNVFDEYGDFTELFVRQILNIIENQEEVEAIPLKRLPRKRNPYEYPDTVSFEKAQYHASGYNQCLKDILGETE